MGLREREELTGTKPQGQRRVLCLGDSFTFGWGVRVEDAWPRRTESLLREQLDDDIRTVNCGMAGTLFPDEYQVGLAERFHVLDPDVVLVSLCLNDVLLTNRNLAHTRVEDPSWWQHSRLLDDLVALVGSSGGYPSARMRDQLTFPATRDVTQEILSSPRGDPPVEGFIYWDSGIPQGALTGMQAWCRERGIAFGVVVWPLFQGLGPGEVYPFHTMHELLAEFCADQGIAQLDLWPAFAGQHPTPELWVSPEDLHGNATAHEVAADPIARFITDLLGG
jgi:lysophospholipase L1-like esterase